MKLKTKSGRSAGFASGIEAGQRLGHLAKMEAVELVTLPLREHARDQFSTILELQGDIHELTSTPKDVKATVRRFEAAGRAAQPSPQPPSPVRSALHSRDRARTGSIVTWSLDNDSVDWDTIQTPSRVQGCSPLKSMAGMMSSAFGLNSHNSSSKKLFLKLTIYPVKIFTLMFIILSIWQISYQNFEIKM